MSYFHISSNSCLVWTVDRDYSNVSCIKFTTKLVFLFSISSHYYLVPAKTVFLIACFVTIFLCNEVEATLKWKQLQPLSQKRSEQTDNRSGIMPLNSPGDTTIGRMTRFAMPCNIWFLPHDAMYKRGLRGLCRQIGQSVSGMVSVCLTLHLSVCLSVTFVDSVKMNTAKYRI